MEGHVVRSHLVELFINTVLYQRHIFPDGIFRKRRAFSTFTFVTIFPPLATYLRRIVEVCSHLIKEGSMNALEVVMLSADNEELECHELKLSRLKLNVEDNDALDIEERMKEVLVAIEAKLRMLRPLPDPENTTFRINIHTNQGSLRDINENTSFQDFPWSKIGYEHALNTDLLLNPVCKDRRLGVDISVNQKPNLI